MPPKIKKNKNKKDSASEDSDSLLDLIDNFLSPSLSQKEIVKNAFNIQLKILKYIRSNENNCTRDQKLNEIYRKERKTIAGKLVFVASHLVKNQTQNSYSILNLIPSLIQNVDLKMQTYVQKLLDFDAPFAHQIPLLHAISELNKNNSLNIRLQEKLRDFVEKDKMVVPAVINVCIFNFDLHKSIKWAQLARETFLQSDKSDLPNSTILFKSKRSCSTDLCNAICRIIQGTEKLHQFDFFLMLALSCVNSIIVLQLIKFIIKKNRIIELSLKDCPLHMIPISNIIDIIYHISASKKFQKSQVNDLARLIFEAFISSRNAEILTFALFNNDNKNQFNNLFEATIQAISIASSEEPNFFLSNFDIMNILYAVPKKVSNQLIFPFLKVAIFDPHMLDGIITYLKKIITRPSNTEAVVKALCRLLNDDNNINIKIQKEIVGIISDVISSAYIRNIVFTKLSSYNLTKQMIPKIKQMVNKYKKIFKESETYSPNLNDIMTNLLEIDDNSEIIAPKDFPASTLALLLKLGDDPKQYFSTLTYKNIFFQNDSYFALQLALRADIYAKLSPFNHEAFVFFSEYLFEIDCIITKRESDIIGEWCSLLLNSDFVYNQILNYQNNQKIRYDPLLLYTLVRQISIGVVKSDEKLALSCYNLFIDINSKNTYSHDIECNLFPHKHFDTVYESYKEELTYVLSLQVKDPELKAIYNNKNYFDINIIYESLKLDLISGILSSRHFQSYLDIINMILPVCNESSNQLVNLISTIRFNNVSTFSELLCLTFSKTPAENLIALMSTFLDIAFNSNSKNQLLSNIFQTKVINDALLTQISKSMDSFLLNQKQIDDNILQIIYILMDNVHQPMPLKIVFHIISSVIKIAEKYYIDNFYQFKEKCEEWLDQNKSEVGAKNVGNYLAHLQIIESHLNHIEDNLSETSESDDDTDDNDKSKISLKKKNHKALTPFVKRKWRSKSKWIDNALKDESYSDENFADLEDFIVDYSPPNELYEEEEEAEFTDTD